LEILLENQKKEYATLYEYVCSNERMSDEKCKILHNENMELHTKLRELEFSHKENLERRFSRAFSGLKAQDSKASKQNGERSYFHNNELDALLKQRMNECENLQRELHENRRILKLKESEMETNVKVSRSVQKKLQTLLIQVKGMKDTNRKRDIELMNQKAQVQDLEKNVRALKKEKQEILFSNKELEETLVQVKSTLSREEKEHSYTKKLYEDAMAANKALHDQFEKQKEDISLQLESVHSLSLNRDNPSSVLTKVDNKETTGVAASDKNGASFKLLQKHIAC
jgi:chromosome segregation ATPase